MASRKHLDILNRGVKAWNKWRKDYPDIQPNLSRAKLIDLELSGMDFSNTNLENADLRYSELLDTKFTNAMLAGARLEHTNFARAELKSANLTRANLYRSNLGLANFERAILKSAYASKADFLSTWLVYANLTKVALIGARFESVFLLDTNFKNAVIGHTLFADCSLGLVRNLDSVKHFGPSYIDFSTINQSAEYLSEKFLRGIGMPDNYITYMRSLIAQPIQFYSCFISYSSKDQPFLQRLYTDLQANGVRCWFAPVDLRIGDEIRVGIDESIRVHDKLLLVLSKYSIESEWVKKEVETAFEQEQKLKRRVLFPIRLDDTVMKIDNGWPADVKRTRHIGDFKRWKDHDAYQVAFQRLLRDLKAEDSNESHA
jgi:uncharacterized protein YjbI with pentapeptide repeats